MLGVLIALVAQQAAENWQWQQTVARTKADLDAQIYTAVANSAERAAVDPCLSQRLSELATKVAASRGEWRGDPSYFSGKGTASNVVQYAVPRVYRTPHKDFPDDVWEQAKAGGVLTRMMPADIKLYAEAFANVASLRSLSVLENKLAAELSFLAFDGPLGPSERGRALSTISRLDVVNKDTLNRARLLVGNAKSLVGTLSADDEETLFTYLDRQREFRGPCVDRAAALKLVAPLCAPGASRTE